MPFSMLFEVATSGPGRRGASRGYGDEGCSGCVTFASLRIMDRASGVVELEQEVGHDGGDLVSDVVESVIEREMGVCFRFRRRGTGRYEVTLLCKAPVKVIDLLWLEL